MGIWKPPEFNTLMDILTIPPTQLNDYDLVLLPLPLSFPIGFLYLLIFSSHPLQAEQCSRRLS